jgi:hypothetical protein
MRFLSHVGALPYAKVLGRSVWMLILAWMLLWACPWLGTTGGWVAVAYAEGANSTVSAANQDDRPPAVGSTTDHTEPTEPPTPISQPGRSLPAQSRSETNAALTPPAAVRAASPKQDRSSTTRAHVWVRGDWPHATLELRDLLDRGCWQPVCALPCGQSLEVEGMEARVTAPAMSPTNAFRIEPGSGTARLRVSGGARALRSSGMVALAAGLAVGLGGASLYGYGRFEERSTLITVGAVTLVMSAVMVVGSVPLLALGRSTVRDAHGRAIAAHQHRTRF